MAMIGYDDDGNELTPSRKAMNSATGSVATDALRMDRQRQCDHSEAEMAIVKIVGGDRLVRSLCRLCGLVAYRDLSPGEAEHE